MASCSRFNQKLLKNNSKKVQPLEIKKEFVSTKKSDEMSKVSKFKPLIPAINTKVVKKSASPNTFKKRPRENSKEVKTDKSGALLQNTVKASIATESPNIKKAKASGSEHLEKTLNPGNKSGLIGGSMVTPIYSKVPRSIGDNKLVTEPSLVQKRDLHISSPILTKKQAVIPKSQKPVTVPKLPTKV